MEGKNTKNREPCECEMKKILKINRCNQENSKAIWKFITVILILISLAYYFLLSALSNVIIFIQGAARLMSLALWGIGSVSIICLTRAQVEDRSLSSQLKLMCSAQKPNYTPTNAYWRELFKTQCAYISPHRGCSWWTTLNYRHMAQHTYTRSLMLMFIPLHLEHIHYSTHLWIQYAFTEKHFSTSLLFVHR